MRLAIIALAFLLPDLCRAEEKLQIATLSTVLGDLAQNVGGDRVTVSSIVKPGVDPHDFEPTPADVKTLSQAKIVLASGFGFESYLEKLRQALGKSSTILVVGDSIKPFLVEDDHDHHGDHSHSHAEEGGKVPDPHWWHSIANVKIATKAIRDAFIAADPAGKSVYQANTIAYLAQLDTLAQWAKVTIAQLPAKRRVLVTSHDALGYFARDYGFEIHPVEGISTADQPSSKKVRELIEDVKAEGVKAIFAENIQNPKVLTEITRETGAKLGGELYADGLGEKEARTYDAMMRHNITTIVNALR